MRANSALQWSNVLGVPSGTRAALSPDTPAAGRTRATRYRSSPTRGPPCTRAPNISPSLAAAQKMWSDCRLARCPFAGPWSEDTSPNRGGGPPARAFVLTTCLEPRCLRSYCACGRLSECCGAWKRVAPAATGGPSKYLQRRGTLKARWANTSCTRSPPSGAVRPEQLLSLDCAGPMAVALSLTGAGGDLDAVASHGSAGSGPSLALPLPLPAAIRPCASQRRPHPLSADEQRSIMRAAASRAAVSGSWPAAQQEGGLPRARAAGRQCRRAPF